MKAIKWILAASFVFSVSSAFASANAYCPLDKGKISQNKDKQQRRVAALVNKSSQEERPVRKSYQGSGRK
ncbi:MAG: hypothetical protein H6626_12165 [Pseudobdellovibrionaceae bacterium]|nr:hypothetical protein [Bdellovibrionales bacterium]USN46942.1 MAG: hypothetical protein H6626_12165 [Pseudobdellovibrionaceae bacterium]